MSKPSHPQLAAALITHVADLARHRAAWDELAVLRSRPYMAPGFLLPWWNHVRSGDADLRTVAVLDGERLVGIAPTFVQRGPLGLSEYRFLGAGNGHRLEPLALPGYEHDVAQLVARTIAGADPAPASLALEGFAASSEWPERLRTTWPRPIQRRRDGALPGPTSALDQPYEQWFAARSQNFRQQMRRRQRNLEKAGATSRLSTGDQVPADLEAMFRLHHARWESRGGSGALDENVERQLREAADGYEGGRMRLWTMEVAGEAIASQLFFAAGDDVAYWGGGIDPAWEKDAPGIQLLLRELEDACERGVKRLDFGGGDQAYKRRFADGDEPVVWQTLFPLGGRWPLTRAQLAPKHARYGMRRIVRRLPPGAQARVRRLLRK